MSGIGRTLSISATIALAACISDPDPPTGPPPVTGPGIVKLQLATPNTDDGAIMITLGGAPFDSVTSAFVLLRAESASNEQRIIVAGAIASGTVASFWVPDRSDLTVYLVSIEQVAVRQTYEQRSAAGYTLTIVP